MSHFWVNAMMICIGVEPKKLKQIEAEDMHVTYVHGSKFDFETDPGVQL